MESEDTQMSKLIDFIVGEIAKSSYLSKPSQFNDGDTKFQKGRLSILNEIITLLMDDE